MASRHDGGPGTRRRDPCPDGTAEQLAYDVVPERPVRIGDGRPEADLPSSGATVKATRPEPASKAPAKPDLEAVRRGAASSSPAAPTDWATVMPGFADAVRNYLFVRGRDVENDAAVLSTIATNSTLVPKRGDDLVRLALGLTDLDTIAGLRVLEAGSGWGSLAAYIALTYGPAEFVGSEIRSDFTEAAREAVAAFDIQNLRYEVGDMRNLEGSRTRRSTSCWRTTPSSTCPEARSNGPP